MKRTTKQVPRAQAISGQVRALDRTDLVQVSGGDVVLHDPKGSNNLVGGSGSGG